MRKRMVLRVLLSCCAAAAAAGAILAASPALLEPARLNEKAPDTYRARFETSKGVFVIEVDRAWSPNGADRFYNLVKHGFYDDARFFRVVPGFVVQWGIPADPKLGLLWSRARIQDDPVKQSNTQGMVTFAMGGPNSRSTQLFINLVDNARLDGMGFAPIGRVVEGMDVVLKLNGEYGESLTQLQGQIYEQGNAFLAQRAPRLDFIRKATIEKAGTAGGGKPQPPDPRP